MSKEKRRASDYANRLGCFVMLPVALPLAVVGMIVRVMKI